MVMDDKETAPMPDTHEMRACPFCGCSTTEAREGPGLSIIASPLTPSHFYPGCLSCGTLMTAFPTRAEALAAWNRRTDDASGAPGDAA